MIHLLGRVPARKIYLAISGGVDSMAAWDFLKNSHDVTPIFFHHKTKDCFAAEFFLRNFFADDIIIGRIKNQNRPKGSSWEEYWRTERYAFLKQFYPVVTAHHLDDQIETWVLGAVHGQPKLMSYYNGLVYRPFLLNNKSVFEKWCKDHGVPFIEDESNEDTSKKRNFTRRHLIPIMRNLHKGLDTTIRNKTIDNHAKERAEEMKNRFRLISQLGRTVKIDAYAELGLPSKRFLR